MNIKKIAVLGSGTMGSGIAQVAAQSGYEVLLIDVDQKFIDRALAGISKGFQKAVDKGKMTAEDKEQVFGRIKGSISYEDCKDVDLVIEAILENMDLKKQVYKQLDEKCPDHAILASNTSSLSITEMAAATKRSDKVVGMHFFNPAQVMKLVEVIPGLDTSEETIAAITEVAKKMNKVPVNAKESPGFIVNRILVPMINEAVIALGEGIGTIEEIDTAMKLGAGMPMGPLALADMVGIDIVLAVAEVFYKEFADSKYRPALLLKQMVRAGHLGVKTGRGFYSYQK
ncbi:3-hydroxyacyl-CoA dehydrogenase [Desulforamulus reducens MI-1]|uniref:3-hydroxybutyryl-CoA dehydrogenase n=1 Tax=Desulforamulus reducens (strain ATCC BAA-1160 / DSM 100696 / MI-1) TaxID=349161 RepID=A4J4M0_DESRM|nr:3-hydroxybutyryl-CoA dehydrogenase [Desulforamulus reducens]ABO50023.1 3-hydroxyacyl-CoA dehydrogenase [Desulforamulus reducens MI-1]